MSEPFIDTNLLVRLLTSDDLVKQRAVKALFDQVRNGSLVVRAPDIVIAETVYVLASPRLYHQSRADIRKALVPLLRLRGFRIQNRRLLRRALDIYATTSLGFGDAIVVAAVERRRASIVYSYDRGFDRVPSIQRREP